MSEKTHWLQNPNKNYLGHWDLPDGKDLILTIESAKWEEVKNPVKGTTEEKRVVRFKEDYKPLICNQINAENILMSTGVKYMEDSQGLQIQLYVGVHLDRRTKTDIDCVRVRETKLTKPELNENMPAFKRVQDHLKGGGKISDVELKYSLTEAIKKKLNETS